ncbi:DNA internalization-related competence protein ComEC/Rec2 [Isoalcanivorax indicus]|uniref:DNA internalization-related competence protein ComEC/Rec2 n=1 Tax=Isoalcanivorax indicus TaxID=2202653 RepID=UPI000DBA2A25|nr:DNA internalization-related competence protein ComEC/Rec2 [Isoalcanivorax indicus]
MNAFVLAAFFALFTGWGPGWGAGPSLFLLGLACCAGRFARPRLSLLCGLLAGLGWGAAAVDSGLSGWLPPALAGMPLQVSGVVADLPEHDGYGYAGQGRVRFRLSEVRLLDEQVEHWPDPGDLLLTWHAPGALMAGDRLWLTVRLRPPRGQVNQGSLDRARLDLARGIGARGSVQAVHARVYRPQSLAARRARLSARLAERLQNWPQAQRLLPALVTADRRAMTADDWGLLQRTGTAHLMAISGLHITLVAWLVWRLSRWLLTPLLLRSGSAATGASPARWAVWPAMLAALAYALLAGLGLPAQRALLMSLVLLLAMTARQQPGAGQALRLALLVLLLGAPLTVLDNGFWLSFGAVALLIYGLPGARRMGRWLLLVRAQLLLSLGLGAFAGWLFGVWGLASPWANLLLVPLFSLVIIPLLLAGALVPGAQGLLTPAAWLLERSWLGLQWLDRLNPSLPLPGGLLPVLLLLAAAVVLLAPRAPWPRWWLLPLCLPWLWPASHAPPEGGFDVVVMDVGQGQAVAVRTRRGLLLYDLGPAWPGGDAGRTVIEPWLARQRLPLRQVFISHGDLDHAGGLGSLMPRLAGVPLYSGESHRLPGTVPCWRGQHWRQDGVDIEVLWPSPEIPLRHPNNASCVLHIRGRYGSALLTGDIYKPVEYWLLDNHDLRADLLLVPHHGSATSSSHALLRGVAPRAALASAGHDNRFGHPAAAVRARYARYGIPLWVSSETGMIVFPLRGSHNPAPLLLRQRLPVAWRPDTAQW